MHSPMHSVALVEVGRRRPISHQSHVAPYDVGDRDSADIDQDTRSNLLSSLSITSLAAIGRHSVWYTVAPVAIGRHFVCYADSFVLQT